MIPYRGKPALALDSAGVIRGANEEATRLLQRPVSSLMGLTFGLLPVALVRVHLDLVRPDGGRQLITARRAQGSVGENIFVALLEDARHGEDLAEAANLAVSDVRDLLQAHRVAVSVGAWPAMKPPAALRRVLADAITLLVDTNDSVGGSLDIRAEIDGGGFLVIVVQLSSNLKRDFVQRSEQMMLNVEAAGGYVTLGLHPPELAIGLILPPC